MALIQSQPERLDLSYYQNDTVPSLTVTLANVTNIVSAKFVAVYNGVTKLLTSADGDIAINVVGNDTNLVVGEWLADLPHGAYRYDIETTDANGVIKTYYSGAMAIHKDVG